MSPFGPLKPPSAPDLLGELRLDRAAASRDFLRPLLAAEQLRRTRPSLTRWPCGCLVGGYCPPALQPVSHLRCGMSFVTAGRAIPSTTLVLRQAEKVVEHFGVHSGSIRLASVDAIQLAGAVRARPARGRSASLLTSARSASWRETQASKLSRRRGSRVAVERMRTATRPPSRLSCARPLPVLQNPLVVRPFQNMDLM